jgi:6-phosphofructokinase 2
MIFTLTMNPCLDRYIYVDELIVDDTIRAKKVVDYPAGKGIDVSRVIRELGGVSRCLIRKESYTHPYAFLRRRE